MVNHKKYRWGILGCGNIADKFAQDLAAVPGAELYAVASRALDKAEGFSDKYQASKAYACYEDLAADDMVDVVYIATPHVFHCEHALLCLNHQKAVLCEKPLGMDIKQVKKMITVAKQQNVFFMEALWTFFLPHYQYVLEIVAHRKFGRIRSLKADFGFLAEKDPQGRLMNKSLGGGSLMDLGVYPLFAALTLLGMPQDLDAAASFFDTGADEECYVRLGYPHSVEARLHCSLVEDTPCTLMLECDQGDILVNRHFHAPTSVTIFDQDGEAEKIDFPEAAFGYRHEAMHVQRMLSEGKKESNVMTFQKSMQLITLLDEVKKSVGLDFGN